MADAPERPKAIDCWLNPTTGIAEQRPEFLVRVARDYFHREKEAFTPTPIEELLRQMEAAGVERAIVTMNPHRSEEHTSELQSHSDLVCRLLLEKKKE